MAVYVERITPGLHPRMNLRCDSGIVAAGSLFWIIIVGYAGESDESISRDRCCVPDGMGDAGDEPCPGNDRYRYCIGRARARLPLSGASAAPRLAPPPACACLRFAPPDLEARPGCHGTVTTMAGI
jgi:hypothetical protein